MNQNTPEEIECPNCGTKNQLNSNTELDSRIPICEKCWTSLNKENQYIHVPPPPKSSFSTMENKEVKNKPFYVKFLIFTFILVAFFILLNIIVIPNSDDDIQPSKINNFISNIKTVFWKDEPKVNNLVISVKHFKEKYPEFNNYSNQEMVKALHQKEFQYYTEDEIAEAIASDDSNSEPEKTIRTESKSKVNNLVISVKHFKEKYPEFNNYSNQEMVKALHQKEFQYYTEDEIAEAIASDDSNSEPEKTIIREKIIALEKKVKPVPVQNAELNLELYSQLLELDPNNSEYRKKVNFYKERLDMQKIEEQDRINYIANLPEKELPENGTGQTFTSRDKIARFNIKSSGDSHYLLKLVDSVSKRAVITIFVRKNSDITVYVPLGDYEIKYASGTKWFGYEYLFGLETSYSKTDENFNFQKVGQKIRGYSITLYNVVDGNLTTRRIDASEF